MLQTSAERYNVDNLEATFREFLITEKVSLITLKNYLSDLRHFLGWLTFHLSSAFPNKPDILNDESAWLASNIDHKAVLSYKLYLENNDLPVKTINRRLSTLRKFCTLCIKQGWMKENAAKKVTNTLSDEQPTSIINSQRNDNPSVKASSIEQDGGKIADNYLGEFRQYLESKTNDKNANSLIFEDINEFFRVISS